MVARFWDVVALIVSFDSSQIRGQMYGGEKFILEACS